MTSRSLASDSGSDGELLTPKANPDANTWDEDDEVDLVGSGDDDKTDNDVDM